MASRAEGRSETGRAPCANEEDEGRTTTHAGVDAAEHATSTGQDAGGRGVVGLEPEEPAGTGCSTTASSCPRSPGDCDEREATYNGRELGPARDIARSVEQISAIHGFMSDLDCKLFDPAVIGEDCVQSPAALYTKHVRQWLDRDPVLSKAEVRDTGGGLHVLLWLDSPIICDAKNVHEWDGVARGVRNVLPCDPSLNGIIAMTRPIGAVNTKYDPPREVRLLREGQPVTREEVLALSRRVAEQPARLWMRVFFGGERTSPCPLCAEASLGVAGNWQCQCYECGRVDAAVLIYRFFSTEFLDSRKESGHG